MSIRKKIREKQFNFGEYELPTLIGASREDLMDIISALNNNIEAHKQREEVIRARLKKCYDYLSQQGLTDSEIIEITKLECELR